MDFQQKIKSSALQYALVIVMIIALLLAGLVLYSGISSKLQTKFDMQERLRANAQSGLEYGKAQIYDLNYNQTAVINLFGLDIDQVKITKRNWGAYDYLIAEVNHQNTNIKMMEMIGNYRPNIDYCLYLVDRGIALSLCGKSVIKGNVKLPKRGVKRAYIAGQNFEGNQLIQGVTSNSERTPPKINNGFLDQLQKPYMAEKETWYSIDTINQSFSDSPIYFFSNQSISIRNSNLRGQVIIESTDSIFIAREAQLNDVIIKAPIIFIENGFVGAAQFIAENKITVSENVVLLYPSVLGLIENKIFEKSGVISIGNGSKIIGSVFLHSYVNNFKKEVRLDISEKAEIHGLAYSNGSTQLKGEVHGSLITKKFFLKTASSAYENHLLNATITDKLPDDFCSIPLIKNDYKILTLKCLN